MNCNQNVKAINKGLIFNIQRYSVHDGKGIRTVLFFKGCPLGCPWCSNPESIGDVTSSTWMKNNHVETVGKWYTLDEIVDEVMKDELFYRTSGGGVTLSGGEILMQSDFASQLLKELQELGINTAIETTGSLPVPFIQKLAPYLDHALFDLKIMDSDKARTIIGINTQFVTDNFDFLLSQKNIKLIPRIPLIPNTTDSTHNIFEIIQFLKSRSITIVHLLPFHQYGSKKYAYLGRDYMMANVSTLSSEVIRNIKKRFESHGITAILDGLE